MPGLVTFLKGKIISQVACGDFHTMALENNGVLYSWGGGLAAFNKGQCGHGHNEMVEKPQQIEFFKGKMVTMIVACGYHSFGLSVSQDQEILYGWGAGVYGEIGTGEYQDSNVPKIVKLGMNEGKKKENFKLNDENYIASLAYLQIGGIKKVVAGGHHSLVLTKDNKLYSFGLGGQGQLGIVPSRNNCFPQLVKQQENIEIIDIAAGWNHSLFLSSEGHVYSCGYGKQGQLGHGDQESRVLFSKVESLIEFKVSKIFAGGNHSWCIATDYQQMSRSSTQEFQLTFQNQAKFQSTKVQPLEEEKSTFIYAKPDPEFEVSIKMSENEYISRFCRVEVRQNQNEKFEEQVARYLNYVEDLCEERGGKMKFFNLNQDKDVRDERGRLISKAIGPNMGQNYTLLMICDLKQEKEFYDFLSGFPVQAEMIYISYPKLSNAQKKLLEWAERFDELVKDYTYGCPKFLEIIPQSEQI